ncbi:MAG TPA: 30S ribosomal protein S2 [Candidatus Sulfotelmatobacter sp.]|nr:30S ribosomal protein S2 [Candidatus Sulfotelmatobacter sp.]
MATKQVDIKELLEAGAHFGHKTERWHPKMAPYIHSSRNGTHIIDLNKTAEGLSAATEFLTKVSSQGKQILFVGTKRQAKELVEKTAKELKMPYVSERWLGGMLTNWNTIGERVKHLQELENKMASGELANKYSKLEVQRFQEEIDQLNVLYGGIKELNKKPGALFVADIIHDSNAIKEANRLGIPIVALVDSNGDPTNITYPIPSNDDAIKTIELMLDYVKQAIIEGRAKVKKTEAPTEASKE